MTDKATEQQVFTAHGAKQLPSVEVDSYNLALRDEDGFVGDNASRTAFNELLEKWRQPLREFGVDPLGDDDSDEITKSTLDKLLTDGHPEAGGVVHIAIEEFAQSLCFVVKRFLKSAGWRNTQCVVVGGGFRASRVGELALGRAKVLLKAEGCKLDIELIGNDPDEAGLIGAAHLVPSWMLEGYDGILAVDIGGTNIRAGLVETRLKKASDLSKARIVESELWRHKDDAPKRQEAVAEIVGMLEGLIDKAKKDKFMLAPVIGLGCPGLIREDGSIGAGAQNLPGNWESSRFNLAHAVCDAIPNVGRHKTVAIIHNDAVIQGLSELPNMQRYERWGVLTIGTGLGNARFTNRGSSE